MKDIFTKGNVIVNNIKIGDIHYEYEWGACCKSKVISLPIKNGDKWTWQSKEIGKDRIIDYLITEGFSHYGPNLYDYEAYS